MSRPLPIDRALEKIEVQPNGCWIWTGYRLKRGYGHFRLNGKKVLVHRFFYNIEHPEFPVSGKDRKNDLDHFVCQNPPCCNPKHLKPVTNRENVIRGKSSALKKNKSSEYTGVSWDKLKKKWCAKIYINKKLKHLGYFNNEKEAAEIYQTALKEILI